MILFIFLFYFWYYILTEEKGVDLGQKKDSYFDNCCHNWPITGKTAVSYDLFWDDWKLSVFYTTQSISWSVLLFPFFFFAVQYVEIGLLKTKVVKDSSFSCVLAMNIFFFVRNTFWTWEYWLKQISTVHGNPFYQKEKTPSKL